MTWRSCLQTRNALSSCVVLALGIYLDAGEPARAAAPVDLRPNAWRQVDAGNVGPRVSPAIVWSKQRQRFLMIGGTISHEHQPPFPYDVLSFNPQSQNWENELPPEGQGWGPKVGPVTPPAFKSPYFEITDAEGHTRLWRRHAKMWYLGQLSPWNDTFYSLICGRTLAYDPTARLWTNLEPATAPAPETRGEKEGLNWSAMCADPINQELLLFGGGGVATRRGDPGTWVYRPANNEWRQLEIELQPAPRALSPLVYDPASRKIVLFGGDGLDRLYADTWVYDCGSRTWEQRRPAVSPSPRFGHALLHLPKCGKIVLLGGVGYTSSTAYQARLYEPLPFEVWTYDVATDAWSLVKQFDADKAPTHFSTHAAVAAVDDSDCVMWWGPKTNGQRYSQDAITWQCQLNANEIDSAGTADRGVAPGTREHRTGSYDPDWYATDVPTADPQAQKAFYDRLAPNRWASLTAPKWPLNRQGGGWSTVAYDTDQQQILHLGGGHSSYFGNDVAHFDTKTARWSVSYRPQFALDFNYDLSGPGPWAFNGGPWGNHNYHAYTYDPARKRLVFIRGEHTHFYDPQLRAWSDDERLNSNPYNGSKYTSYVTGTPGGVVLWALRKDNQFSSGIWQLDSNGWSELKTRGEPLPRPVTDGSTITYDSRRNRLLLTTTGGEKDVEHSGQVWACNLATGEVEKLNPAGQEHVVVKRFARESVYLPKLDRVMLGYHIQQINWIPFYNVSQNCWQVAEIPGSEFFSRTNDGASVDLGLQYDANRDLVWGIMCKLHPGSVQALRIDDKLEFTLLSGTKP